MPVQSLAQLARKSCIKNVNSITDIGDAEYDLVRPVLLRLQNPKQLYELEQACPQIIGADAEIWKEFCKRDIPDYEKNPQQPSNPQSWYKCYQKLYKAGQKEIDADAALLKATMDQIKSKQAEHKAQQVELRGVKVPDGLKKDIPTIALPKASGVYRAIGNKREYIRDSVAKGPAKAVSTMAKIRKETVAQSHFAAPKQLQRGTVSTRDMRTTTLPTKTTIVRAPKSLIEAHQKAKISEPIDPTIAPSPVFNPKKRRIEHVQTAEPDSGSREAREKRLKAPANPFDEDKLSSDTASAGAKNIKASYRNLTTDTSDSHEMANASSLQSSPSGTRSSRVGLFPSRSKNEPTMPRSPRAPNNSPSPQIRSPMRVHRASDNPLMANKRRTLQKA